MKIFFLNSTSALYNGEDLNQVPKILFSNGIFNTLTSSFSDWLSSGDLLVQAGGGMTIEANKGIASILASVSGVSQRLMLNAESPLTAQVSSNASIANRNDAVVLRINQSVLTNDELNSNADNAVSLVVIAGGDANELTDAEISTSLGGDPYIRLADILVPLSTTEITNAMITDARSMVEMTNGAKFRSDEFGFNTLTSDPTDPEDGDVWYNKTEGILKFFDGENTTSLQTQTFDWGYYPPDGIDQPITLDAVAENDSEESIQNNNLYTITWAGGVTIMEGQLFEMPSISQPFFRIKMGNPSPEPPASVKFAIYSVDGSDDPVAEIENLGTINYADVPVNDFVTLFTSASFTAGQKYLLVALSTRTSSSDSNWYQGVVQSSSHTDDDVFKGKHRGSGAVQTTNPLNASLSWTTTSNRQLIMSIGDVTKQLIGQTDSSGNFYKILQPFIAKSKDILNYIVIKGSDVGTPTGDIDAKIYKADENDKPTGNVLAEATIAKADWDSLSDGDDAEFEFNFDNLVVGTKYVVIIETENQSDADNYTIYFVENTSGETLRNTTAEGWVDAGGDIVFSVETSSIRKIVVTGDTGKVPQALIPRIASQVQEYVNTATPEITAEDDALLITALDQNITSVTLEGTPDDFQEFMVRITDLGTGRTIAWGSDFEAKGVALPTTVGAGKTLTVWFIWDSVTSKYGCILSVETT